MRNPLKQLKELIGSAPLQVGTVIAVVGTEITVQLPGDGVVSARGSAVVDDVVYVRDGVIEGLAPSLAIHTITI